MQNYKQPGKILTLTAPYARSAGQGALVGAIFGVACNDVENAAAGEFNTVGVHTLTKVGSQAWAVGDKIYWDNGNKRCTTDSAAGMLIGVATAVVASGAGDTTGDVRLNGTAPSALEGPQALEAALVDNSGGAAADGTIAAVTAPTEQTDSSGGVANATLAAQTLPTALTDNGGGTADATVEAMSIPADLTWHADIENAAANGALVQSSATNPTKAEFDELAHEFGVKINALNALALVMKNNFKELTTRQGENLAQLTVLKAVTASYAARQAENRAAIVALTDAIKELSTKQNAILAKIKTAGIIASA